MKTRGANRLRYALKGGKSRGGGVAKSSTVAKGVHLGWTGPMRGRAQKAEQTSSRPLLLLSLLAFCTLLCRPHRVRTSSPAMDVEPPTERAPAEGEAPAPAGAAGGAMDGAGEGVDEGRAAEGGAFPSRSEPVDLELPSVKNVDKPGENPPPPNKPEAGGGEALLGPPSPSNTFGCFSGAPCPCLVQEP